MVLVRLPAVVNRVRPPSQQETIAFKDLIGYKKPPPKWKKPFNGIPVEALSKENWGQHSLNSQHQ